MFGCQQVCGSDGPRPSVRFVSQVSVWAWQTSRRDTASRVTATSTSAAPPSFSVRASTRIIFQDVHVGCLRPVKMWSPSGRRSSNPPPNPPCVLDRRHRSRMLRLRVKSARRNMLERAAHLRGRKNTAAITITSSTCSSEKSALVTPDDWAEMCEEKGNRKLQMIFPFSSVNGGHIMRLCIKTLSRVVQGRLASSWLLRVLTSRLSRVYVKSG